MKVWLPETICTYVQKLWETGPKTKVIIICLLFDVVESLMDELDPNHKSDVNEEEFLLILKYIQQRSKDKSTLPQLPQHSSDAIDSIHGSVQQQVSDEKKKYGALLPKSGVYFLPDEKVVGFLK